MRGVSELITSLPTFKGAFSFFGDELHMLGHGIGHMAYNFFDPSSKNKFKVSNSSSYTFDVIDGFTLRSFTDNLGKWIAESKNTTPILFDYSFDSKTHFYRAVDWQHYLLHVVPTSVVPYLRHTATKMRLWICVMLVPLACSGQLVQMSWHIWEGKVD